MRLQALFDACAEQSSGSLKHGVLAFPIIEKAATWRKVGMKVDTKVQKIEQDVRESFEIKGVNSGLAWAARGGIRKSTTKRWSGPQQASA